MINSKGINDDLSFSLTINFNTDEAIILPNSYNELNELISLMNNFQDLEVQIIGHTDDVGSLEKNLELSIKRAIAVKDYMILHGIEAQRLNTEGKGETQFISDNNSELGRAENRRVEFKLSY